MKLLKGVPVLGCLVVGLLNALAAASHAQKAEGSITLASQVGAHLDSDRLKGGGTDDTQALQSILDRAKNGSPVHLKIDGTALIRGLEIYGATIIECSPKGGFYLEDGAERAMLRNAHRSRTEILDRHITIRGCFFNGNREGQRQIGGIYKSPRQEQDGTFKSGLQFFGVEYLKVQDVVLWNTRAFGAWVANAREVEFRNVTVDSRLPAYPENGSVVQQTRYLDRYRSNDDGLHFNGPVQNLLIDGLTLTTEDDGIGVNANDMGVDDMTVNNEMGPYVGQGPITDVTVRNVRFKDALQGIRLLSSTQRIDRICIRGLTGRVRFRMAILSHFIHRGTGNFGSITFGDVAVVPAKSPSGLDLFPGWGRYLGISFPGEEGDLALFSLNSPIEQIRLENIAATAIDSRPIIRVGVDAKIGLLEADLRITDPLKQAVPLKAAGGEVERLHLKLDWKTEGGEDIEKAPIAYQGTRIRQLNWIETPPRPLSVELTTIEFPAVSVVFTQDVQAADVAAGVSVRVNGKPRKIARAKRALYQSDLVNYVLEGPVSPGDAITWTYDATRGDLQNANGIRMPSVSERRVAYP